MSDFFKGIAPVPFKGPDSDDPLAFRFYEKDRLVLGKRMEDQLRMAVAYWHSFAWQGGDPFGGQTFERPWFGGGMAAAKLKAEVAFEMFTHPRRRLLHLPRPRHRARGQEPRRVATATCARSPTIFARRCRRPGSGCSGARRTSSPTAASWPARPPTPTRTSSPMPRRR